MASERSGSKCIVITGAARGIGRALVEESVRLGYHVIAVTRRSSSFKEPPLCLKMQVDTIEIDDIAREDDILKIGDELRLRTSKIDILFNCAGVSTKTIGKDRSATSQLGSLKMADLTRMFQINALAPLLLTQEVRGLLKAAAIGRVINISSRDASFALKTSGWNYGYTASKVALNMLTLALAHDLRSDNVISVALHPGWVRTDMGGSAAPLEPPRAAQNILRLALNLDLAQSGAFLGVDPVLPG